MCGGRQAVEDTLLSKEEGARADGEESAFALGVFLLNVREGFDEAERFGFSFEDGVDIAARDDEDVKFGEAGIGFLKVDVCAEAGALLGGCVFGEGDEGGGEGFSGWEREETSAKGSIERKERNAGPFRVAEHQKEREDRLRHDDGAYSHH